MKTGFKKVVVSAFLGLSVIISSGGLSVMNPLTVQAAVSKPKINLTKKGTITVGRGSQLALYKNVIKSVKKGTYPVKSVKVASVKAANGKKIGIKNSPIRTTGRVPAKTLVFPSMKGTYKLRVTATDNKGSKITSTVNFKVRPKKLSSYVKGLKTLTVTKGASVKYLRGITYDRSKISGIKVDSSSVNTDKIGTYKVYYNIIGIAGDKLKIARKVNVKAGPTLDAGPSNPTTPAPKPTTPAPSSNPADHVTGIKDRVVLRASKNLNLMDGVKGDDTIKSIQCLYSYDDVDPYHYNLPAFGETNSAPQMYTHEIIDYLITTKTGVKKRVEAHMYVVDLPTAKDLANAGVKVYMTNNAVVAKGENNRHTCNIQVSADKILVPAHKMQICYNCNEEMGVHDDDWLDSHVMDSFLASKGQGPEGAVPGCGNTWYGNVEAFTISR